MHEERLEISMEQILLNAEPRTIKGKKVKDLRRQGYVPAVMYGHRTEPVSLQVTERELRQVLREAGSSRLITLSVAGTAEPRMVLVRDLQRDSINHAVLHVDLYEVIMTEKLTAEVPIVLMGEAHPVKAAEGLLFHGLDSIEVECLPGDLPENIQIDLSQLTTIGQAILVRDLKVGEGIEILTERDEVVVKILPLEEEVIEEVAAPEVAPEVEVVGRKAEGEAEEEAAAGEGKKPEGKAPAEAAKATGKAPAEPAKAAGKAPAEPAKAAGKAPGEPAKAPAKGHAKEKH
jgi:large subunit ribosomal protein L25